MNIEQVLFALILLVGSVSLSSLLVVGFFTLKLKNSYYKKNKINRIKDCTVYFKERETRR